MIFCSFINGIHPSTHVFTHMFPPCSSYDRLCGAVATLLRPHWLGRVSEDPSHSGRGCRVSQGPPTPPRPCLIHPLPSHQEALSKTQRGPRPFLLTAFPGLHPLLCRGRCPGVCPGSSAPPSRPVSGSQPAPSLLFSAGTQASHTERNPDPSGCLSPLFLSLPWSWRLCWSPPCLPLCCELPSLCSSISCVLCASSRVCSRSRTRRGQDQRVPRRTVTPAPPPGLVCAGAAGAGLTVPGAASPADRGPLSAVWSLRRGEESTLAGHSTLFLRLCPAPGSGMLDPGGGLLSPGRGAGARAVKDSPLPSQRCWESRLCSPPCPHESEVLFNSLVDISGSRGVRLPGGWQRRRGRLRHSHRSPRVHPEPLHASVVQEHKKQPRNQPGEASVRARPGP